LYASKDSTDKPGRGRARQQRASAKLNQTLSSNIKHNSKLRYINLYRYLDKKPNITQSVREILTYFQTLNQTALQKPGFLAQLEFFTHFLTSNTSNLLQNTGANLI
jgi:hypothetical protein